MNQAHRFQVEIDWQGNAQQGTLRLTHAATGRIVDVSWQDETMLWRDNQSIPVWQPLSQEALFKMGVVLPPWTLAQAFAGQYPSSMHSKDQRTWRGAWGSLDLKIKWSTKQERVQLTDIKNGRQAIIIFNQINNHHAL